MQRCLDHLCPAQEQEARVRLMRKRAREREGLPDLDEEEGGREAKGEGQADGHINFFADLESGVSVTRSH